MGRQTRDDSSGSSSRSWRHAVGDRLGQLRKDGRASAASSVRITIAAVASYVVATLVFPGSLPLLAPLTAMLVVQVTPVSLLASGVERVVAVVTGVALAVAFASVAPLEWWSLGILIFVSVVIGHLLRLGANLLEVPISAMLVLGVGAFSAESAAWDRIAETLVGAAVGVLGNLLFPPKVASGTAADSIDDLAGQVSGLLDRAAEELADTVTQRQDLAVAARPWLDRARRITEENLALSASALAHAEQGRRLNVRALGTPDVGPGLRQGLEALEHSALAVRSMFRTVIDVSAGPPGIDVEESEDVLLGLAQTFRELAAGIAAFGALVRNEAGTAKRLGAGDIRALSEALEGMSEARARLDDLLMSADTPALAELQAVVATTIRRLSAEMDLQQRVRRQIQLGQESRTRPAYLGRPAEKPPRSDAEEAIAEAETLPLPRLGRGGRHPQG
ncbi:putative Membrane protein-like protein [metagenome]|uniref:Putative Membrane protein-like protein n=1 Tax=metagenome TaxID=256318 RepID=A0A2P2C1A8_9ZZZZ